MYCQRTCELEGQMDKYPLVRPPGLEKSPVMDYNSAIQRENFLEQLDGEESPDQTSLVSGEPHFSEEKNLSPCKVFSMALPVPLMKPKILKNCASQASDIEILLTTLGHSSSLPERCVFHKETEWTKDYEMHSSPSMETRPAPSSRDSDLLPTLKDRAHWLDFLHSIFPKVECSELAHLYDVYGMKTTVDILAAKREMLVLSDCILQGGFEAQLTHIQATKPGIERSFAPKEKPRMTNVTEPNDELLTIDVSSLQSVLSEQFGDEFPTLVKLPRHVIQSIVHNAEFLTKEALVEEQLARDSALAQQMEKADMDDIDRHRVFSQTARLFPAAIEEPPIIPCDGYKVVGSCAPRKPVEVYKNTGVKLGLTLEEAQGMAQMYISEAELLDKEVEDRQLKMTRGPPAAFDHYRTEISKLVKKKLELRENADTLIRDANIDSGTPNLIDLHCMSVDGASKFVKAHIRDKNCPGRKLRIVTGHRNGASVIRQRILNDLKSIGQKKWIIDSSSNAGEIAITFK